MRYLALTFGIILLSFCAKAQQGSSYTTAAGIKFYPTAFTFKHFVSDTRAVEGIAYIWENGVKVSGLYQFHFFDMDMDMDGIGWYVGGGAHVGFWSGQGKINKGNNFALGVDFIAGLDYKIPSIPINISLDWNPGITLVGSTGIDPAYGGISIRYVIR
jgi:hypothetical protein